MNRYKIRPIAMVVWLPAIYLMITTGCHSRPNTVAHADSARIDSAIIDSLPSGMEPAVNDNEDFEESGAVYNVLSARATGDLNKDNISDSVVVMHDTTTSWQGYRLQVFFGQPDGQYRLAATSTKAILPEGGDNRHDGINFDTIRINKGVLTVSISLLRGMVEYLYRYQNQRFELIGYSRSESDGQGLIIGDEYNLSTGRYIHTQEPYDGEDRPTYHQDTIIPIRPLPIMDTLIPFTTYHKNYVLF